MKKTIIAIDADGVLLNYSLAYKMAWLKAFGEDLQEVNPKAYYPLDRWGARVLTNRDQLAMLHSAMGADFWANIPALDGAVEACVALHDAGYELVCVTALAAKNMHYRLDNLKKLNFPIQVVHATGQDWDGLKLVSPKAKILEELNPIAFVDDFAPYLRGVNTNIHKALIMGEFENSPNKGEDMLLANSQHKDLWNFSQSWLSQ